MLSKRVITLARSRGLLLPRHLRDASALLWVQIMFIVRILLSDVVVPVQKQE